MNEKKEKEHRLTIVIFKKYWESLRRLEENGVIKSLKDGINKALKEFLEKKNKKEEER